MKYIDTSALVKYYANIELEKGAVKVTELIETAKAGGETLLTSIFTIAEAVSVFDKWVRLRFVSQEEASKLIFKLFSDFQELTQVGALIVDSINSLSIMFSIEHIIKHHLPINDSIHLYTALKYKTQITEFISSDEMQILAAKNEGLSTMNPEN